MSKVYKQLHTITITSVVLDNIFLRPSGRLTVNIIWNVDVVLPHRQRQLLLSVHITNCGTVRTGIGQ